MPKESPEVKRGVMGGTFDPIHLGHLRVAEEARNRFNLDKVVFVPAHCPPHKSLTEITAAEHRYAMVDLAIRDNPHFESSRIEMERECPSYAGDTIRAFKKKWGRTCQVFFITGLDALLTILNWKTARTFPGLCQFIAATRPGYNKTEIEKKIPPFYFPYITILEEPLISISSTEIRARIRAHLPIDTLVPGAVKNYIYQWGLYLNS